MSFGVFLFPQRCLNKHQLALHRFTVVDENIIFITSSVGWNFGEIELAAPME